MSWTCRVVVAVVAAVLAAVLPAAALAQPDPNDSISLNAPVGPGPGGAIYTGYLFSFSGGGVVDGNLDGYTEEVLFAPSSSPLPTCPASYAQAVQEIELAFGGPGSIATIATIASYEALGVGGLTNNAGPYAYAAYVNAAVVPTVTNPGSYVACAYLIDALDSSETYAVSPAPVAFTVKDSPGTGTPPQSFGGPPGKTSHPANLTLTVKPKHSPIRAPGRNLLEISGRYDPTSGPAGLVVTIKSTARYNGCASNDGQDLQITRADGGVVLAYYESVSPNQAGKFQSPLALNFEKGSRRHVTAVVCAYLVSGVDNLAVGYDRFVPQKKRQPRKRKSRHRLSSAGS